MISRRPVLKSEPPAPSCVWSAEDLARASALGVTTIRQAELSEGETSMTTVNDTAVRRTLEVAGVEFIDENGGARGAAEETAREKNLVVPIIAA
jgi:hypothetical protein